MHSGVSRLNLFAFVMSRTARGERQKLHHVRLKQRDVLRIILPCYRFGAMKRNASTLYVLALPIDAWVLQGAWNKIRHDIRNARLSAESIVKGQLALDLGGLVGPA